MAPVDLVDDVEVARQQVLEQVDGPALQGFGQDRVVGVGTRAHHNVPGLDTAGIRRSPSSLIHHGHAIMVFWGFSDHFRLAIVKVISLGLNIHS